MGYEWDIFISYRRKEIPKKWMENVFLPLFEDYLEEELGGRKVKIFRDTDGIESSANWKSSIKRALATSKCIVPILIPSYFRSEWCTKEISVIYKRQIHLGYNTVQNPNGLIIPLKIHDGIHFPKEIKEIQILDCNDFYRVGPSVEGTQLYIKLQDTLLKWVSDVAKSINGAPEWNPKWLTEEWLEEIENPFLLNHNIKISNPTL